MEKKTRTRKTKEVIKESPVAISPEEQHNIENMRVHGFQSSMEVAKSIMGSIHENLLCGDLIFAYTSTGSSNKAPLFQVVVVNDLVCRAGSGELVKTEFYSISLITSGYSAYIPHMPLDYLSELAKDLEENKADKKVIESFKKIITNLKEGGKV